MTWVIAALDSLAWFFRQILYVMYLFGVLAAGIAVSSNWSSGRGSWFDVGCALTWPVCVTYVEVGRYFRQPERSAPKRVGR